MGGPTAIVAEDEPLKNPGHILFVAGEAILAFDNDRVETSSLRRLHHREQPVAFKHAGTGLRPIRVDLDDLIAFAARDLLAQPDLIINRAVLLDVD